MGCDIHWHSETRRDGVWVCDQVSTFTRGKSDYDPAEYVVDMDDFPDRDRDYWLFGLLNGGVRCEWPWSFPYTDAIPKDCSDEVKAVYKQWRGDHHSAGSKTRAELRSKVEELKLARAELLISPRQDAHVHNANHLIQRLEQILSNLSSSDVIDEDQRIVFWFDN